MMKIKDLKKFKDKNLRVFLKNNRLYTGKIVSFSEDCLSFLDKFNQHVTIGVDSISHIEIIEGGVDEKIISYKL